MLKKITDRKTIDFSSFPNVIRTMATDNSTAATVIDLLIETKGEAATLAALILLDDMNIRGIQLANLYKMCQNDIENLYDKIINISKEDIHKLNQMSASLCTNKAVFEGTSEDRENNPHKYVFTPEEREAYFKHIDPNSDLYPTIKTDEALKIIKEKGFTLGYEQSYTNNHQKETYRVFYNEVGDILYTSSLDDKDIFLWRDSKLNAIRLNNGHEINYLIELKDHPFKTYEKLLKNNYKPINDASLLPVIKTIKGIKFSAKNSTYNAFVTASIYDLLTFNQTYQKLDAGLKKIYEPLLETASDIAYDELIKHLNGDSGIEIATNLQTIFDYNLSNTKLLAAKERFCQDRGHNEPKRKFLSRLVSDNPSTSKMNHRIIEVLNKEYETV